MTAQELCELVYEFVGFEPEPERAWERVPTGVAAGVTYDEFALAWRRRTPLARMSTEVSTVLWLRPRVSRGTQSQIPTRLLEPFFQHYPHPIDPNGKTRRIGTVGGGNTNKFELPEWDPPQETLLRFEVRPGDTLHFDVLSDPGGRLVEIMWRGVRTSVPRAVATRTDLDKATIWTFD